MANAVKSPTDWSAVVEAAALLQCGYTVTETAESLGVARGTIYSWKKSPFWPQACYEAERKGTGDMVQEARSCVLRAIQNDDVATAKWVLDRRDMLFAQVDHEAQEQKAAPKDMTTDMTEEELRNYVRTHTGKSAN